MSSKPTDELLDHNYDGIREFDNPIPAWWNWIFIGSIVFSMVYFFHYHIGGTGQSAVAAYEADMEKYREKMAKRAEAVASQLSEEKLLSAMHEPAMVEAGKVKFAETCAACHGQRGEGLIGPNLTDSFWIHSDGSLMSIRKVVAEGVAEKGMPPWDKSLSAEQINQVVAFLGTLRGTNVEGKAPEGDEVETKPERSLGGAETESEIDPAAETADS